MTIADLREYLGDESRTSPAIAAARELLAAHDRFRREVIDLRVKADVAKEEIAELQANVKAYRHENERLRIEISRLHPAPWEVRDHASDPAEVPPVRSPDPVAPEQHHREESAR